MAVFVSDTFTDTNGRTLAAHIPDIGGDWVKGGGRNVDLEIQSNAVVNTSLKNALMFYTNAANPGSLNHDVQMDVTIGVGDESSRGNGLVGRYTDANNYYYGWYREQASIYELFKRVDGQVTSLDTLSEGLDTGTFEFKLELTSTPTQKFYLDDAEKLSATDSALTNIGHVGMIAKRVDVDQSRDNFLAEDTAAPESTTASMQPIHAWWQRS